MDRVTDRVRVCTRTFWVTTPDFVQFWFWTAGKFPDPEYRVWGLAAVAFSIFFTTLNPELQHQLLR